MPNNGHLTSKEVSKTILNNAPHRVINSITFLGEGDFCSAYLVNQVRVFRFAKHPEARESLKRESCLLPKISNQITLPIPAPQIASFEGAADHAFIAYKLLSGKALSQKVYLSLDMESRTLCAKQTARFLNEIHSIDLKIATACRVKISDYSQQYSALLRQARTHLFARLEVSVCRFIEQIITGYLESGEAASFQPVLLHGDLSPGHLIFDERTKSVKAIIDFGDVMIGDPAWDLLWIYEDYGLDFLSRVLDDFHETDRTPLLKRVFQFSQLEKIQWAVSCLINNDHELPDALNGLPLMKKQKEKKLAELLSLCRTA